MKFNRIIGLEIHTGEDEVLLQACMLRVLKDQLGFEQKSTDLKSILHFAKNYKPGPVAVCLTGRGIMTKKIDRVTGLDQQVIHQLFPGVNPDQYYFQLYHQDDASILSAVRRKVAEEMIGQLTEHGFRVLSLTLDAMIIDEVLEISTEKLDPKLSVAYAVAFQMVMHQPGDLICIDHALLHENRIQIMAKAKLKGIAMITMPLLFLLLLINFLLFTYYSGKVQKLSSQTHITETEVNRLQQMEAEVNRKVAFVRSVGWTGGLYYAYINDQLAASLPARIRLKNLVINPLDELQGREKQQDINLYQTVELTGVCDQASVVNDWFFALKVKDWIVDCKLVSYGINQDNGKGVFTVRIQLREYET